MAVSRGVWNKVHRMAQELERTELQRELVNLQDHQSTYYKTSRENSESAGSWKMDPEETAEWSSKRWQSMAESKSILLNMEESEGTEG